MRPDEAVRQLLSTAPGEALCDACLAFACAISLTEMRAVTERLVNSDAALRRGSSCRSCRRTVPAISYGIVPGAPTSRVASS